MKKLLALGAAAAALLTALPAAATTYIADFSPTSSTAGAFTFGSYYNGTFTAFPTGGTCLLTHVTCLTSGNYLGVYKSNDGLAHSHDGSTVDVPASGLFLHPGQNGELSVILFTAPTAGTYTVKAGAFQTDSQAAANNATQTVGYILGASAPVTVATLTPAANNFAASGPVYLAAGETLGVFVGNDGSYYFDSTGVDFSVSSVPEATTWAMMLAGFGMIGLAARRRASVTKSMLHA